MTFLLTWLPGASVAQDSNNALALSTEKAPVVVDGKVLFQVGSFGNYTAAERAYTINEALKQEVRSPEPLDIEVVRDNPQTTLKNQQTILRSRREDGEHHLLTVTWEDTIAASSTYNQARIWLPLLEKAIEQGRRERTPIYRTQALMFTAVVLIGAFILHWSLVIVKALATRQISRWLGNLSSPLHSWEDPAKLFLRLGILGLQVGLWAAVAFYVSDLFPQLRSWRYQLFSLTNPIIYLLTARLINLGESSYSVLDVLLLVGLAVGLWFAVRSITRLLKSYVLGRTGAEAGVQEVIATLTQYILTLLGLFVLLQSWGLDLSSLTIVASVLGVGIGFGVQNIANNFISGLIITLERPIQVGDFVEVNNLVGTVERIGARSTVICTLDRVSIIVPNSRFLESEVINWSHGDPISRLRIPVGVAYGSRVDLVQKALLEAAKGHPEVLLRPKPQVWFQEFADSSLNFDLLVWTGEPKQQPRIKSELNYRIEASLRRYGIQVPFPQRDLHVKSPQIERLITALLKQNGSTSLHPESFSPGNGDRQHQLSHDSFTMVDSIEEESVATVFHDPDWDIDAIDLEELVVQMRGKQGVEIKSRRYLLKQFNNCFVGSEAVTWLMETQKVTRDEAIELGQRLMSRGIIHHVTDDHPFRDDYLFYRFYADEE